MKNSILHRRESIILSAIDVINELGIQGLSIREVAKRQGISNAAIFSHFKSKSELVLAVLDHFTQYDNVIIQALRIKELHAKAAIRYYVDYFYTYYENYPAITAILQAYDGLRCESDLADKVKNIFKTRSCFLQKMIKEAQACREIRDDLSSEYVADIIEGNCKAVCLRWRIEEYSFSLKERVLYTINVILDSFSPKVQQSSC